MSALAGAALVLSLAVGNIMSNPTMPQREVTSDISRLYSLGASATCATEIEPSRYKRAMRQIGHADGYRVTGLSTPNPVAVRRSSPWRAATVHRRLLSRGIASITPERWAVITRLENGAGGRVVVICAHLVSRAWTHHEPSTALRRALWRQAAGKIRRVVAFWHRHGTAVIVLGDLNHPSAVRWTHARQRVIANRNLIQIAVIPAAGQQLTVARARTIPNAQLNTDHAMLRRQITLD